MVREKEKARVCLRVTESRTCLLLGERRRYQRGGERRNAGRVFGLKWGKKSRVVAGRKAVGRDSIKTLWGEQGRRSGHYLNHGGGLREKGEEVANEKAGWNEDLYTDRRRATDKGEGGQKKKKKCRWRWGAATGIAEQTKDITSEKCRARESNRLRFDCFSRLEL